MVDETGFQDTFGDNDLADPSLLPGGTRFIGEITAVDTKAAQPGNFRKFANPLKDGRMEVPMISFTIRAKKEVSGSPIVGNFNTFLPIDFWIGSSDVIGRASLARLAAMVLGCKKEDFSGRTMSSVAEEMVGGKVTCEASHRSYQNKDGETVTIQGAAKVKAASEQEMALLM